LHRDLYIAIILERYEGPKTPLSIAFLRGLYIAIILDRYERLQTPPAIALLRSLYLAIKFTVIEGPKVPFL
jgi:hypothetical protein